jgi:RimJ/RimL family protein N-acetyltransferase
MPYSTPIPSTILENRPVLENPNVRLEPIAELHREGLRAAAKGDPEAFAFMPTDLSAGGFDQWFDWSLGRSEDRVWTVVDRTSRKIVGSTRYLSVDLPNRRVEIGYTWYARAAWGGPVNPACKYLLFQFGFENLGLNRIELKTDARNLRSRAAITKLGAKEEGILRRHMIVQNGHVRDTVYFSVIAEEWAEVKRGLESRLAKY